MSTYVKTNISTDSKMAQDGLDVCVNQYIINVKKTGVAMTTANKYESMLKLVFSELYVPIAQITSEIVNKKLMDLYYEKTWSSSYVKTVLSVVSKFLYWCRENNYTLYTFKLVNPIDGKSHLYKAEITSNTSITRESVTRVPNVKEKLVQDLTKPKSLEGIEVASPDKAIESLLKKTNLRPEEIEELDIYDFMHNRIIVQANGNRDFMRIVKIDNITRNLIYMYLSTRKDTNNALFISTINNGERITLKEIRKCL